MNPQATRECRWVVPEIQNDAASDVRKGPAVAVEVSAVYAAHLPGL